MLVYKKTAMLLVLLGLFQYTLAQTPQANELVGIHPLTQTEINAIANRTNGNTSPTFVGICKCTIGIINKRGY